MDQNKIYYNNIHNLNMHSLFKKFGYIYIKTIRIRNHPMTGPHQAPLASG